MAVTTITASTFAPLRGAKRWAYLSRAKTIRVRDDERRRLDLPLAAMVRRARAADLHPGRRGLAATAANFESGRQLAALVDAGDEYATVARRADPRHDVGGRGSPSSVDHAPGAGLRRSTSTSAIPMRRLLRVRRLGRPRYFELIPDKMIGWDMRETDDAAGAARPGCCPPTSAIASWRATDGGRHDVSDNPRLRVLVIGESWIKHTVHMKGFDQFHTTEYEEGGGGLPRIARRRRLRGHLHPRA